MRDASATIEIIQPHSGRKISAFIEAYFPSVAHHYWDETRLLVLIGPRDDVELVVGRIKERYPYKNVTVRIGI